MSFLARYGSITVFGVMLLEHLGLPIPAPPVLLAAGGLAAAGALNGLWIFVLAIVGALLGDWAWYELGRRRGAKVLSTLCRVSMEPDTCVRRTENTFARYGVRTLVAAKFLPGFSRVAPPLAGIFKVPTGRFFLFDGLGAALYAGVFLGVGVVFRDQMQWFLGRLAQLGLKAAVLAAASLAGYVFIKWVQRRLVIRSLRMARITPEELHGKLAAREPIAVVDLRSRLELEALPYVVPTALHIPAEDFDRRHSEIPRDRDIVLYCSCPNETTSARVAIKLRRKGITKVRPLLGGISGWRYANFDLQPFIFRVD